MKINNFRRKIRRLYKLYKPYKQFVFHFNYPMNSIDARNISKKELEWCRIIKKHNEDSKYYPLPKSNDYHIVMKMFKLWFPEELI